MFVVFDHHQRHRQAVSLPWQGGLHEDPGNRFDWQRHKEHQGGVVVGVFGYAFDRVYSQ